MRIGMGYDVHRLTEGRDLILGGVRIPFEKGLLGHSDADVVVHAIMDALLGAAALGDIGQHFPDTDPRYKGISSIRLLERVGELLEEHFYFIGNILEKEEQVQKARLMQEKLENQMEMYRNTQESETRYRRYLHDYKNQLGCIHGMLKAGKVEEALDYIEELNSGIRKGEDCVDTNHLVVNTVLNQKYQYARERGITMVMSVNDLSGLTMSKEDIVALLVNLLDNAVEACEKLDGNKIIQFKMMLEEEELTVSVRNPVKEPVVIKGKRILTTKREKDEHGIGFLNINSVIEKNHGTSVLKCQDGWFYFSAVLHI